MNKADSIFQRTNKYRGHVYCCFVYVERCCVDDEVWLLFLLCKWHVWRMCNIWVAADFCVEIACEIAWNQFGWRLGCAWAGVLFLYVSNVIAKVCGPIIWQEACLKLDRFGFRIWYVLRTFNLKYCRESMCKVHIDILKIRYTENGGKRTIFCICIALVKLTF